MRVCSTPYPLSWCPNRATNACLKFKDAQQRHQTAPQTWARPSKPRNPSSLLAAGLVDELYLTIAPVAVGQGRALFSGLPRQLDLRTDDLTRFDDGTLAVRYRVTRS